MYILKDPEPVLRKVAKPVEKFDDDFREKIGTIEEFMWNIPKHLGKLAGLAAPQVGISQRFFYMFGKWYVNPEIIWTPKAPLKEFAEGCYSLEDRKFDHRTFRHYSVGVKYQDLDGEWHEERLKGVGAQCFQHEFDHLNGILACDHIKINL